MGDTYLFIPQTFTETCSGIGNLLCMISTITISETPTPLSKNSDLEKSRQINKYLQCNESNDSITYIVIPLRGKYSECRENGRRLEDVVFELCIEGLNRNFPGKRVGKEMIPQ